MQTFVIEIAPKNPSFDALSGDVRLELVERGISPQKASVSTRRLYKIQGAFSESQIQTIAQTLLVDPVVETVSLDHPQEEKNRKKKSSPSLALDVWPKIGVTDPVGETVEKGLRDLGYGGTFHATSGLRYLFHKIQDSNIIKDLAKRSLANELIHDINIRKVN